ncbi:MAG TPA: hypothetical protein VK809_02990 [Bacteroidia bacterium]|jgi:hypothetical protein|nr:hypothetical protein [Bacteroidia bacterium]
MRKATSIFLTLTFLLYLGGIQIMFWVKMSECKQEAQALVHGHKLSRRNIIDFSFTPSEYSSLSWSEENKEFTYKGQRYDIIEMKYFSDEIIVNCYPDKDETDLVDAFSGFIKKMFSSPQHGSDNNNEIVSKIVKEYLPSEPLVPCYYSKVLTSVEARFVLVNLSAKTDCVWRPPTSV